MIALADIIAARQRIEGRVRRTPCERSPWLSEATGARIHLKLENLQMTGSFKERGALNRLTLLTDTERGRGVVAASAGNHAQGVAYHARQLGIGCTIVMPRSTPLVKVTSTRHFGAHVVLHGDDYATAYTRAVELGREQGSLLIHSFDDAAIVAGQGTIGLELLEQVPDLQAVVVAVGGGGLIGGIAVAIKEQRSDVRVYGVEAALMPAMQAALAAQRPVGVPVGKTIADGIAVTTVGALPYEIAARYLDGVVTVDEEEIAEAILVLLEREKTAAEGAGAAPLAALLARRLELPDKDIAVVIGGGNIDVNVLSRIIDRGLIKSGRLKRFSVLLPDVPGALARLLAVLADAEANVLQITHDRHRTVIELGQASVELEAETRGFEHIAAIEQALARAGFDSQRS
jgi:threonine dehydratase